MMELALQPRRAGDGSHGKARLVHLDQESTSRRPSTMAWAPWPGVSFPGEADSPSGRLSWTQFQHLLPDPRLAGNSHSKLTCFESFIQSSRVRPESPTGLGSKVRASS